MSPLADTPYLPVVVGGTIKTVSFAWTRPTDSTAYAPKDTVAPASTTITAATNAAPIVVTATAHGLVTGDCVTIAGCVGNTAANGDFVVTVLDADTFSLDGSTGNGVWSSGGTVVKLLRAIALARLSSGYLVKAQLETDQATCTARFRLHTFNAPVSAIADNAPYTSLYAQAAKRLGSIDLPALAQEGTGSTSAVAQASLLWPVVFVDTTLHVLVEVLDAFTPASGQKFTVSLTADLN